MGFGSGGGFKGGGTNLSDLDVDSGTISVDTDNNRVGIGTTSPSHTLVVDSNSGEEGLQVNGARNQYAASIRSSTRTGEGYGPYFRGGTNSSDAALTIDSADGTSNYLKIRGDGNVGIGTASPDCTLHVAGAAAFSGPSETFATFSASDTTPSVSSANLFKTHASTQTLTMFDDGITGQTITIISTAAVTYDVTSTNLKGGSTNITTANGDVTQWIFDGTNWYLLSWMDVSANLSSGGF